MDRNVMPIVAVVGAAALAPAFAWAGTETDDDLRARIAAMEQQLAALRAESGDTNRGWLSEQRATEIRALVQDVLADADSRASLLQDGATAGYNKNFFLQSADGNFLLKISGQMQFRYVFNHQDDEAAADGDTTRSGFENRRTKLTFEGNVLDPTWKYHVTGAFERDGGSFVLEDAFVEKELSDEWSLMAGQFKLPFMREENMSSKRQLAVDRSLVNEEFNQDRSQGVQLTYQGEQFGFAAAFSDGFMSDNVGALVYDTEYALTGRAEFLAAGEWDQFKDFTSWRGSDFGLLIGGAAHFEKMEFGTVAGPEVERFTYTVDASAEFDGFNLFGAFVGNTLDDDASGGVDLDQWGVVVQGGIFLTDECELFARYEFGDFDVDTVEDLSVVTVGVNKYWNKHNLKWTTDVGLGLDAVNSPWSSSGVGWRADTGDEDGQIVVRSQLQLLF